MACDTSRGPALFHEGAGWVDERIAEAVEVNQLTVSRVRNQYVEEGLQAALNQGVTYR